VTDDKPNDKLATMKAQVYKDQRPAEYFTRFHERTRAKDPDLVYELVRLGTGLWSLLAFRARPSGRANVPKTGQVILAPNHFSYMDHFFVAIWLRRRLTFMAKSQMFKRPLQFVYTHGGVFPLRRGFADQEAHITARTVLARGGAVLMYCEGGRSRTGQLSQKAKPGIGRLALESGAPVVPVAIHGSQGVRNWKRLRFPKVRVAYGEPLTFPTVAEPTLEQQQETADTIYREITRLYETLNR
jgi:1-acyl-sn-glycerol-3-phosphate acyltransferase